MLFIGCLPCGRIGRDADNLVSCSALGRRSRLMLHVRLHHLGNQSTRAKSELQKNLVTTRNNKMTREHPCANSATHDARGSHEHTGLRVIGTGLFLGARVAFCGLSDLAAARVSTADRTPSLVISAKERSYWRADYRAVATEMALMKKPSFQCVVAGSGRYPNDDCGTRTTKAKLFLALTCTSEHTAGRQCGLLKPPVAASSLAETFRWSSSPNCLLVSSRSRTSCVILHLHEHLDHVDKAKFFFSRTSV
jgi:hypothetical protein